MTQRSLHAQRWLQFGQWLLCQGSTPPRYSCMQVTRVSLYLEGCLSLCHGVQVQSEETAGIRCHLQRNMRMFKPQKGVAGIQHARLAFTSRTGGKA